MSRDSCYDTLAQQTLQRSPAHVMLLHVNAINAASIEGIVAAFRSRRWTFTSPLQAFDDPVYRAQPMVLPAGESIVWALAKAAGAKHLRYPAEDSPYEQPALQAKDLLP